jgi:hypothetical protein
MTLPDPSIVLLVDSTAPHIEQGRYRSAEHSGSHRERTGQASTSMIRLCKKAWMPAVQALSRASSMRYERL